jgi:hypothetical protein
MEKASMTWTPTRFIDWQCWEARINPQLVYRIISSELGWTLYRDNGIATEVWSEIDSLDEAKKKAELVQLLYARQQELMTEEG